MSIEIGGVPYSTKNEIIAKFGASHKINSNSFNRIKAKLSRDRTFTKDTEFDLVKSCGRVKLYNNIQVSMIIADASNVKYNK